MKHELFQMSTVATMQVPATIRSSHLEVFLGKGFLKTCSKFTGEDPCRNTKHLFQKRRNKKTKKVRKKENKNDRHLGPVSFNPEISCTKIYRSI